MKEEIVDGVRIITDDDGNQHFEILEEDVKPTAKECKSIWQKIKDWWNDAPVKPYVKVRDLANPFNDRTDPDAGSDGKNGIEVGIKISF